MDYILLNSDGSIKNVNFTDFIQQNNDGVNKIFVSCEDLDYTSHSAVAVFVLPDGSISEEPGVYQENVEYTGRRFANGYLITLTQNETKLSGLVFLTINIKNISANTSLYSYRATITINKTADQADLTYITLAQYLALKDYIDAGGQPINTYFEDTTLVMEGPGGYTSEVSFEYLETNYIPYNNANKNVNLGNHDLTARDVKATDAVVIQNGITALATFGADSLYFIKNGVYRIYYPTENGTFATREWANNEFVKYSDNNNDVDLGVHGIRAGYSRFDSLGIKSSNNSDFNSMDFSGTTIAVYDDEESHETLVDFPRTSGDEEVAYRSWVRNQLPKKSLICQFNTSSFVLSQSNNYVATDIPITNFIEGSDLIIITWDNCFAICPIPAIPEADGRVVAAMWNASGEAQTIRVRYAITDNNTLLTISLQGGFTPPSNHTAYVFCYKIV